MTANKAKARGIRNKSQSREPERSPSSPAVPVAIRIPIGEVLKTSLRRHLDGAEGKAELRRIGDRIAFTLIEEFISNLEQAAEAGGEPDAFIAALIEAHKRCHHEVCPGEAVSSIAFIS